MDFLGSVKNVKPVKPVYRGLYKRKKNGVLEPVYIFESTDDEATNDAAVYEPSGRGSSGILDSRKQKLELLKEKIKNGGSYSTINKKQIAAKLYMEMMLS